MKCFFLISVLVLGVLPFFYGKYYRPVFSFFWRMCVSDRCRLLYSRILILILLAFHFFYSSSDYSAVSLTVSSVLLIFYVLAGRKRDLLALFRGNVRKTYLLFLLTLASCFVPRFLSVSVTLGFMLAAVCFYPSFRIRNTCALLNADHYFGCRKKRFVSYYLHMSVEDESRIASEIRTLNIQNQMS